MSIDLSLDLLLFIPYHSFLPRLITFIWISYEEQYHKYVYLLFINLNHIKPRFDGLKYKLALKIRAYRIFKEF